jgi:hypothetical protein
MVGHLTRTLLDHRRHRDGTVTLLAVVWPIAAVAVAGTVPGNLSPPLFGVPILLLLATSWMEARGGFLFGVVAFYVLSSVVTIATFRSVGTLNWWFLAFWPLSFLVLMTWRSRRLAVRADKSYTAA